MSNAIPFESDRDLASYLEQRHDIDQSDTFSLLDRFDTDQLGTVPGFKVFKVADTLYIHGDEVEICIFEADQKNGWAKWQVETTDF